MKNKYYTPKISEFHVGFEFEVSNDIIAGILEVKPLKKWYKQIYGESEPYGFDFIKYNSEHNLGMIRVKYLNKEDIESLGFTNWIDHEEKIGHKKFTSFPTFSYIKENYKLQFFNDCQIRIYKNEYCLFEGIIKNKSELKIMLEQVIIDITKL